MSGFRASIDHVECYADGTFLGMSTATHQGSLPSPFDACDGGALAAPDGRHPLPRLDADALLVATTDGIAGGIEVEPTRVGEGIQGVIRGRALRTIAARRGYLRLVGLLAREESESRTHSNGNDSSTTERWVQVHGDLFASLEFAEVPVPAQLATGQSFEIPFLIPAPRLGPPSAHAGVALVAWAVEAHWDIQHGGDEHLAAVVDVAQHPDLLGAGVIRLGAGAMHDVWSDGGATLSVDPVPPYRAGATLKLGVAWPGAAAGRAVRIELTTDVDAANDLSVSSVVIGVDRGVLQAGVRVPLELPADLPPTLATEGLAVSHRLRVIIDRKLRPDEIAERRIVVC